ncbi:MAG TPA: hypothetical protein VIP11_01830 [Gemmatimonadaceae bacterium]
MCRRRGQARSRIRIDVEKGSLARIALPDSLEGDRHAAFAFSSDERTIAVGSDILTVIDGATGKQRGYVCPYFCNRLHHPVEVPFAVSPDGRLVAASQRNGAGIFDVDADTLIAPLEDPAMPPRVPRR